MMQKDYLLRIAAELASVLTAILGFRQTKQYQAALDLIDQVFKQALGFGSDLINSVPDETLLAMLTSFNTLDVEKCLLVATLLNAEGDIYLDQSDFDTSYYRYLKSLHLFLEVLLNYSNANDPDILSHIEELLSKLEDYELPVELKINLFRYYERTGRYSQAEDTLFEVIEADHNDNQAATDILEQGIAFYQRLLKKKDADLVAGNFSREKAQVGLTLLQTMKQTLDN
jgi:tetratricopeptide (TPR) repeat protein